MAAKDGSDDPSPGAPVLLLRDPVTGNKLRCREQVVQWRELHEDLATDLAHDDNVDIAVGVTTGIVFGTIAALDPVGVVVTGEGLLLGGELADVFSSDDATELLASGIVLYRRKRFDQARATIERALSKDASVGVRDKALFYLGLSYVETGKRDRAKTALKLFVDRSSVRDVDAYREAAGALKKLGVTSRPCESTDPVDLHW